MILAHPPAKLIREVQQSLPIIGPERLARECLNLLAVRGRPVGDRGPENRQCGVVKSQSDCPVQPDAIEEKRQLRMIAKPLAGKCIDIPAPAPSRTFPSFQTISHLSF